MLAKNGQIIGAGAVVSIYQTMGIGVVGLEKAYFLSQIVHLRDEPVVELFFLMRINFGLFFNQKKFPSPDSNSDTGVISTWEHKPIE